VDDPNEERERAMAKRAATMISNLSTLLAATLISLACAEIVVRFASLAPEIIPVTKGRFRLSPNPKIGYEPIPNIHYEEDSLSFYQYRGTSNELGYRGPTYPETREPGTMRIVVIGDSIVEGIGIDDYEELFSAKVERALRESGIPAQVFNFGVSGYNTQQEVETLKDKALRFDPDLVLLAYCLNDTSSPDYWILKPLLSEANQKEHLHRSDSIAARYLIKSALYRLLRFHVFASSSDEKQALTVKQFATGDTVEQYIMELSALSNANGFDAIVVVFPHFTDRTFENYAFSEGHEFVRKIVEKQDLLLLDLLPAYQTCRRNSNAPLHRDNLHPNALGHTCAANAITQFILETVVAGNSRDQP